MLTLANRLEPGTSAKAVFLDRDGVVIENRADYVKSIAEVSMIPRAVAGMALLAAAGFVLVFVTNQAAVGRGLLSQARALSIQKHVLDEVAGAGVVVSASYICPHVDADDCACRKPRPGMLLRASSELGLDLSGSFLVGDAWTDIDAALAVGVRPVLVRTGRGEAQLRQASLARVRSASVADTLFQAAVAITGASA